MATAMKLAAGKRRGIHVLGLITVPNALTIDSTMPEEESSADSAIEQARIQGGRRVSGHKEKIRAGQAGRRIIEEATDMRASAIVLPLPRRVDGASLFGKTLETVLAERPCRVIIESAPDSRRAARRAGHRAGARAVSGATQLLSALMIVIGVAIIVRTLAAGGGALALGLLLGVLFVAAGAGRLYAERRP